MTQVKVGDYLFQRLKQIGIASIFGVPRDYEHVLLDLVFSNNLQFKGNPNELVASHAADGYARVKKYGAFVTTFGRGELSAYGGMADQYTEFVPVAHIVGYPAVTAQGKGLIMHHNHENCESDTYRKISTGITAAITVLTNSATATAEIDRVLNMMIHESRPVYIGIPIDIAYAVVFDTSLQIPLTPEPSQNDPELECTVVSELRIWMETKMNPVMVIDGNGMRNVCTEEINELAKLTGFPIFVTVPGKGFVNETLPSFGGTYGGAASHAEVNRAVETSDAIFWFGSFLNDVKTGGITTDFDKATFIGLQRSSVEISSQTFDVKTKYVLQALIHSLQQAPLRRKTEAKMTWNPYPERHITTRGPLTQDFVWHALGDFFQKGDYIISDTGTSASGIGPKRFAEGVFMHNQAIFGSTGHATEAAVGCFQAIKEDRSKYKRGILVIGEGSFHLTVQTVADMLRFALKPIILILNSGGHSIERPAHGRRADYNDIAVYDYSAIAQAFRPAHRTQYFGPIRTAEELTALIGNPAVRGNDCFTVRSP
ncbi:MAG: hypothetical protein Q9165_002595 [Trypethelium subeluteriae]